MLPTGTVTFLFTDIQGSTPLWEREPEKMADALQVHNTALRQAIEANGGVIFKFIGDEFQAAFDTAPRALKAAIEGQQALQSAAWNELGALSVRMGLHTGEAELDADGDEYAVSHTKNRIGRVRSAAYGGQILLSEETADLVKRKLPEGVTLKDLGEHQLKGMAFLEHLYQVCAPGLPHEFPPLASRILHPHNLPLQMTSFIGREKEILQVVALLEKHRLVTLTGSGGTGKTRLALQVAEQVFERFSEGVWFIELAPLADAAFVPRAVLSTLGLREVPGQTATQVLCEYLRLRHIFLVLDNCEHVVDAAAGLADALLHACPHLQIQATSREILGVAGEIPFRCSSLSIPDLDHPSSLLQLGESEAVRLFVERAQTASPGFVLTDQNAPIIGRLCQRLDGIPLAIELAATRVRLMSVEQILSRLDHSFRLLTGGSRTVLPRHQTLKALIDWSYNLLTEKEQLLLLRLSVFAGGWTLEAAEAVCAGPEEGWLPSEEILDLMCQLIDKSLVILIQDAQGENTRYRLLETIHQYAHDRLLESGGGGAERERHLDYFLSLCLQAEGHLRARDRRLWVERLEGELDNLRLAMEWSLSGSIAKGLRLAAALFWFWHGSSHRIEGFNWLNRLLAAELNSRGSQSSSMEAEVERKADRGKALYSAAYIGTLIGRDPSEMFKESVSIFQSLGDRYPNDLAFVLYLQGGKDPLEILEMAQKIGFRWLMGEVLGDFMVKARWKGDLELHKKYASENLALEREIEDVNEEGFPLWELGTNEFLQGNYAQAGELFEASRASFQEAGNPEFGTLTLRFPAWLALSHGDYSKAKQYSQSELAASQEMGIPWVIADALGFLGWEAWLQQDEEQAVRNCEEALKIAGRVDAVPHYVLARIALSKGEYEEASIHLKEVLMQNNFSYPPVQLGIQVAGMLAAAQAAGSYQQLRRAAVLFGGQGSLHKYVLNVISPIERGLYARALADVRQVLGEEEFDAAWAEGQAMTAEQAVAYALEEYE